MKFDERQANYRVISVPNTSCHTCRHRRGSTCRIVNDSQGRPLKVDPQHVCDYYESNSFVARMFSDRR